MRDKVEVSEPVKEKGKVVGYQTVVKDQGVSDKRLLVVESEFAQTLKVVRREGNTLSPVIRQAWDTGTLRTLTRNDPTVATDAHISILGHITRQELGKDLSENDCSNGFANRFLWVAVKRSQLLPDGGSELDLAPLQARLAQALCQTTGGMSRSPAARSLWHDLYPSLTADRPGAWGKATSRGEAQTLRLSMIYALLDGTTVIDVPHLQAALAVWQYAEASARLIFHENEETLDPLEKLLLEQITRFPGINRKRLHKALGGHVSAEVMVKALGTLAEQGKARAEQVATGGRPSECWSPILPTPAPIVSLVMPTTTNVASERTKTLTTVAAQPEDSSFARNGDVPAPAQDNSFARILTLAELCEAVKDIGGRLERHGDVVSVNAPAGSITPKIEAALAPHQEELRLLLPTPVPALPATTTATVLTARGMHDAVGRIGGRLKKEGDRVWIVAPPERITPELEAALALHHDALKEMLLTDEEFEAELASLGKGTAPGGPSA